MKTFWIIAVVVGVIGCGGAPPTGATQEALGHPVGDPCRVNCHIEFDQCNESCAGSSDQPTCMCLCQNILAVCIGQCNGGGTPPLRECPPSDSEGGQRR